MLVEMFSNIFFWNHIYWDVFKSLTFQNNPLYGISTWYIFVDKMNASYVAMHVTRIFIYSLNLEMNACMNEYSWLIRAFVQLRTYLSF